MEEEKIIETIDAFLEKEGLDVQSKFILTKKISEEYWEEVLSEGEEGTVDDSIEDLGETYTEEPELEEELPEEEIAAPKPPKKKKITVKKPKVTTKKEEEKPEEEVKVEEEKDVL